MLEGQGSEIFPKKRRNQFFGRGASSGPASTSGSAFRAERVGISLVTFRSNEARISPKSAELFRFPCGISAMGLHTRPVRLGFDPHYARDPLSPR
jgi:hypothetical protein